MKLARHGVVSDETSPPDRPTLSACAVVLGERIDPPKAEGLDVISTTPLAFRFDAGMAVVFRYGVVVLIGLDARATDEILRSVLPSVHGRLANREEETVRLSALEDEDDGHLADGVLRIGALGVDKLLLVADALAKSAALAQDERHIADVFDTVEPWARQVARTGRSGSGRRAMIRQIGSSLLVQHRLTERVAFGEKPDILWDRPDLERLHMRLEAEYELIDRGEILRRKLDLIGQSVTVMTDLIDTQRSFRLEALVAILIVAELVLTLLQMARG